MRDVYIYGVCLPRRFFFSIIRRNIVRFTFILFSFENRASTVVRTTAHDLYDSVGLANRLVVGTFNEYAYADRVFDYSFSCK